MGMKKTAHQRGRKYTTEDLRLLMKLWEEKADIDAIATELSTTRNAILKQIVRMRAQGIPLSRRTRSVHLGRSGQRWTPEEAEYLFRRRLAGATSEEIATDLGRTTNAVSGMVQMMRANGVPVAMKGQGVKRLWDPNALKSAAVGRFDEEEINLAQDVN